MLKWNKNNLPGYESFEFDVLCKIILKTQLNKSKIQREFKKLAIFYKSNPDLLYESLSITKEELELKEDLGEELTEFEKLSLNEINNLLFDDISIEDMFAFQEDYLLDDYSKIYSQISKKDEEFRNKPLVDIIYYDFEPSQEIVPIGEYFSDGSINTGSSIKLRIFKLDPELLTLNYKILFN